MAEGWTWPVSPAKRTKGTEEESTVKYGPITWEDADPTNEICQEGGITSIAFREEWWTEDLSRGEVIVGYNGILKGDKVTYNGKPYTVVMVSRLGTFGLSETGQLPYVERVWPKEVQPLPSSSAD